METVTDWLVRARDWLDAQGKVAWIGAIVLGFIVFWPLGLAVLFYAVGSKRMMCVRKRERTEAVSGSTGNVAFDTYRKETLRRLEEERDAFLSFLEGLRAAKDRAEFDQFMARRDQVQSA